MRTVFVLLFLIFIGSGFLLSDNIHMQQDLNNIKQQNTQFLRDIKTMQDQVGIVNAENAKFKDHIGQLAQSNAVLENQIRNLQQENLAIKDQNTQLQSQLDRMTKLNQLTGNLIGFFSQSLNLAFLVPILPVSLAATIVLYRYKQRYNGSRKIQPAMSRRNITVQLTEEELKEIVKMRRTQ